MSAGQTSSMDLCTCRAPVPNFHCKVPSLPQRLYSLQNYGTSGRSRALEQLKFVNDARELLHGSITLPFPILGAFQAYKCSHNTILAGLLSGFLHCNNQSFVKALNIQELRVLHKECGEGYRTTLATRRQSFCICRDNPLVNLR